MINKPIIIIGMHRSGTSFLSKVLEEAGVFMGVEKEQNNESLWFLRINEKILSDSGYNWTNPGVPDEINWHKASSFGLMLAHFGGKSIEAFSRIAKSKMWGWKDPRNTFTLPMWLNFYPQAKVINIYRNGIDVALSLYRRNEKINEENKYYSEEFKNICFGLDLWENYLEQSFKYKNDLGQYKMITVQYESLINHDQREIEKIEAFTKLALKNIIFNRSLPRENVYIKDEVNKQLFHYASQSRYMRELGYLKNKNILM